MDIVASLYQRNNLRDIVSRTVRDVFIPLTVGGGIRSVDDVRDLLRAGADKVAVNTAALRRPELITEIAETFGSQCLVLSVEAKRKPEGGWEAYTDNGRERTGIEAVEWVHHGTALGAGEVMVTSVDREGTRKGFDIELVRAVSDASPVPVIASGGMGTVDDLVRVCTQGHADAVAMADILHYGRSSLTTIRELARGKGIDVRVV
jgi:imidazole glycerol-phosphate synthase subunit HisF